MELNTILKIKPLKKDNLSINDIFEDQVKFWNEGTCIKEQEDSMKASIFICSNPKIIKDVNTILNRVAEKSDRLLGNYTTNLAESWMHMRNQFDGRKVCNHCLGGSWQTRCFAGELRCNEGPKCPFLYGNIHWDTVWAEILGCVDC